MNQAKSVGSPIVNHFRLSLRQFLSIEKEENEKKVILYASAVGKLMYDMICTRSDIHMQLAL